LAVGGMGVEWVGECGDSVGSWHNSIERTHTHVHPVTTDLARGLPCCAPTSSCSATGASLPVRPR
jgi:hypothetical protein